MSVAGSIAGGAMRNRAIKAAQKKLEEKERENQDWYTRRYNEDATARADAQRSITMVEDAMQRRNRAAAGTAAVMGGTQDAVLAQQAANAQAVAGVAGNIAAAGEARKDAIESQFIAKQDIIDEEQRQADLSKANAIAQATQGVMSAGASIADAFDGPGGVTGEKSEKEEKKEGV